ncbi:MAG TPA: aminomethyltransferase family protein, partial [Longimicrobiales bacterium]|nr:aminomethyltransferase family protein [Longimicrobiales bacterium]
MLLKQTPFHSRTSALNQSNAWRRWAGYIAASVYELSHEREYAAIRNSAALFDVSPLYKYHISGPDAAALLNRVITRDINKVKTNQVIYTPWCDAEGKVLDDGTVTRFEENFFRLTSAEANLRWLHLNARKLNVRIEDVSESTAALSLQGPESRAILEAGGADVADLKYFHARQTTLRKIPVTITRTGYTGDLGYEIWIDQLYAESLWDTLMETGRAYGLLPAGLIALDIARNEAGLILLDVDYISAKHTLIAQQKSSPFEINLGWAVPGEKTPYVGKRALDAERARPGEWRFVGIDVEWTSLETLWMQVGLPPRLPTQAWRMSVPLFKGGKQIGYATSGTWSPILKKYIALAHVRAPHFQEGTTVE